MTEPYDIAVLGAGPGGYVAALEAARLGARTLLVEKADLGGTCLNHGCIPSKALLSAAELLHEVSEARASGLLSSADLCHDWSAIQKRKNAAIATLRHGIEGLLAARKVAVMKGTAALAAPGHVVVEGVGEARAKNVIVAVGSQPALLSGWPDDPTAIATSDQALHWGTLPRRLAIVGGGVIGCEFACMMQAFGVTVTVLEMMPELLPGFDHDVAKLLAATFEKRKIGVRTGVTVTDVTREGDGIGLSLSDGTRVSADRILVSVGRTPRTEGLGGGFDTSPKGFLRVDDALRTNVADHFAIGDVNGRCLLAHAASAQAVVAVANCLGGSKRADGVVPSVVYTFPEIGSVGLTEDKAREQGIPIAIGRFSLSHLGKAIATGHTAGFVKVLRHRETDAIVGVHMIGRGASECVAAATVAVNGGLTIADFAQTVWAHPTMSESMREAADDSLGRGLHLAPRKILRIAAAMEPT
jgi:dihydrolipoamide dehydrogenase